MRNLSCDIFCKVIDNYGDIGVCWRLARQLVAEHGLGVRLWVDDLACFQQLAPQLDPNAAEQDFAGLCVRRWDASADSAEPADIVIEAFACDPPASYITAMAARPAKPVWINLEYLTAEDWAAGSHALPSPHPRLPLTKHFFFPGFTPDTGGLLRESSLIKALRTLQSSASAQADFWQRVASTQPTPEALKISLFAYENAGLAGLLNAWADGERDIFCAVTSGRHLAQVKAWQAHRGGASGKLTLAFLPFLSQPDYDLLLAACDLNFVRGEDSFVRAQWAGRPFVWHIYQQEAAAHLPKLAAFLDLYCAGLGPAENIDLREFWQSWENEENPGTRWPALHASLPKLQTHSEKWAKNLVSQPDLAAKLLIFCKNLLECAPL